MRPGELVGGEGDEVRDLLVRRIAHSPPSHLCTPQTHHRILYHGERLPIDLTCIRHFTADCDDDQDVQKE